MQNQQFELQIVGYIDSAIRTLKTQPLMLGGRPGGFIGKLGQTRVAYDADEAETFTVPLAPTLVTNLNRIRYRIAAVEAGVPSGTFLSLLDTPSNYTGDAGKSVVVNLAEDGLHFETISGMGQTFLDLSDTPNSYTGNAFLVASVNETETALEFVPLPTPDIIFSGGFTDLTDVPDSYAGAAGKVVVVKGTEDGVEFASMSESGHIIQDNGTPLTQRSNLNFTGIGVLVEDDPINDSTLVNISISGGGGGTPGFQTLIDESNILWDLAYGSAKVTISGVRVLSDPINMSPGEHYFLNVIQGTPASGVLTFETAYKFKSNNKPVLSTYPGSIDTLAFECDGTYMFNTGFFENMANSDPILTYITNMLMWLKADADAYSDNEINLCTDSDSVYLWKDQSGNENHAIQTESGNRPIYKSNIINNMPVVRFNGISSHIKVTAMDGGSNVSFFIVILPNSTTPIALFDSTAGSVPPIRSSPAGYWDWYYLAPSVDMELTSTSPVLLEFIHSLDTTRNIDYYKNGSIVSSNPVVVEDAAVWGDPRIGSINDGSEGWYDGDIAEFIIYSETISNTNRQTVENYLKLKYGIS